MKAEEMAKRLKQYADARPDGAYAMSQGAAACAHVAAALLRQQAADIERLRAALKDVLARIERSEEWWMDCPDRGGFDCDMIRSAMEANAAIRALGEPRNDA